MIEQEAQVVRADADHAVISIVKQSACGSCKAKSGCGTSVVSSLFPQRRQELRLANPIGAKAGDRVIIGLPEAGLQRASLRLYGIPLLGLLVGAALGDRWGGSEPMAIAAGLLGIVIGFGYLRWVTGRGEDLHPVLLRRVSATSVSLAGFNVGSS